MSNTSSNSAGPAPAAPLVTDSLVSGPHISGPFVSDSLVVETTGQSLSTENAAGGLPQTVRFGVVGCGWVARDYGIPGLIAAGEVVHLCDRDADAVSQTAAAVGTATTVDVRATTSLQTLLADESIDAVYVATPNHTHAAIVRACAAAGKAILCEKPLAASIADAEQMIADCAAAEVLFATAYDQRWHPAHRAIGDLVSAGVLGTITQARIHYACWLPSGWSPTDEPHDNWRVDAARAGGGAGIDLAPHGIDLLAMLLGRRWDQLHGLTQRAVQKYAVEDRAVDDGAVLMGQLGETLATLHVGYNCPDRLPRRRLELIGTAGSIIAENTMGQTPGGCVTHIEAATGTSSSVAFDAAASPFEAQARWFASAVRGESGPRFDKQIDLHHHRLLLAALG